jgi:hypothetical protein
VLVVHLQRENFTISGDGHLWFGDAGWEVELGERANLANFDSEPRRINIELSDQGLTCNAYSVPCHRPYSASS